MKNLLLIIITTLVFIAIPVRVFAQDESLPAEVASEAADALEAEQITEPAENQEKISELQRLYTLQIESYRQAEREYIIAKEQYQQLETLRLLEEAVQATKDVMLERNKVLLTYLELLYFTLQDATGVNLLYKEEALKQLEAEILTLREFQISLEETTDRAGVAARAQEFAELRPEVESTAYRTLTLISIGKLQTVHDKARLILNDLRATEKEASSSALRKAQLLRAFDETERNLETVNEQLRTANDTYARQDRLFRKSFYENILRDLGPVYVQLSQLLSYLRELLTI